MANLNAPMPTFATPFLRDGLVNEPWYRFLFQLQIRTGGTAGVDFATQAEFDELQGIVTAQGKEIDAEGVYTPFNPSNLLQRIETFVVPTVRQQDQKGSEVVYAPPYSYDTVAQAIARFASPPAIGNTTPNSGAFTTLNATSTVSGAGFTTLFASPPSIGNVTPGAGSFTTLSATSTVSGAGFTALFSSPPPIGSTTANSGKFTTVQATGTITPSSTAGIVGTTTNDNANAGSFGEFASNSTTATPVTNGVVFNATSVSLTAGDWDVEVTIGFNMVIAATLLNNNQVGVSTTSATMPTAIGTRAIYSFNQPGTIAFIVPSPTVRISLPSTTTVYAVGFCAFSSGTITADGFIRARRVR